MVLGRSWGFSYVTSHYAYTHFIKTHRVLDHEVPRLPPPADRLPTGLLLDHPLPQRRGAGGRRVVAGGGGALLYGCGLRKGEWVYIWMVDHNILYLQTHN